MKKLQWKTGVIFSLLLISCGRDDITVRLSLYETDYYHKHYIKAEIRNNTGEDLLIPYFNDYYSVYHGDVDVTRLAQPDLFEDCYNDVARMDIEFDTLDTKRYDNYHSVEEEVGKREFDLFLKDNQIDSTTLSEENKDYLEDMVNLFCNVKYVSVVFLRAGETVEWYTPIHGLYCEETGKLARNFTVKFQRHGIWDGLVCDTIPLDNYKFSAKYPATIAGYELYDGSIHCDDVIHLRSE